MMVLPTEVNELLGRVVEEARVIEGQRLHKKDLIAALVMLRAPNDGPALAELFRNYGASTRYGRPPMLLGNVNVTVALPPPVTHRIDLLVALARGAEAGRVLRRDLVAALITVHAPRDGADGVALHRQYLGCTAADAAVPGRPLRAVLTLERPSPGRRRAPRTDMRTAGAPRRARP